MSTNKRGRPKTGLQTCEMVSEANLLAAKELIENLKEQLAAKDQIIREKDKQIFELAKLPRIVINNSGNTTNTVYKIVDARINPFGAKTVKNITEEQNQDVRYLKKLGT